MRHGAAAVARRIVRRGAPFVPQQITRLAPTDNFPDVPRDVAKVRSVRDLTAQTALRLPADYQSLRKLEEGSSDG